MQDNVPKKRRRQQGDAKPSIDNYDISNKKLTELSFANLTDLPDLPKSKTIISRTRLFVTNIPLSWKPEDLEKLFEKYGKNTVYVCPKKSYCLVTMDSYESALKAIHFNNYKIEDKVLKVRFSQAALGKVENLCPYVSNELLYTAFGIFGEIDSCHVIVNERGKSTETGIVEFKTKAAALNAVKRCRENCFFVSATLKPAVVELCHLADKNDSLSESSLWKDSDYYTSRSLPPRFAKPGSLEHIYAKEWLELHRCYTQKQTVLEQEFKFEVEKLQSKIKTLENEEEIERLKIMLMEREKNVAESKKRCQRLESIDPREYFTAKQGLDFRPNTFDDRNNVSGSDEDCYRAKDRRRGNGDARNYEFVERNDGNISRCPYGYESC